MLSETAKDIAGYEGKYSVTTDGRVYSHSRVIRRQLVLPTGANYAGRIH